MHGNDERLTSEREREQEEESEGREGARACECGFSRVSFSGGPRPCHLAIWRRHRNNGGNDGNVTFRGRNNCTKQRSTGRPGAGCGAVGGNGPLPPEGHTHEFYAAITKVLSCGFKVGSVSQWLIIVSSHTDVISWLDDASQHRAQTKPTYPLLR